MWQQWTEAALAYLGTGGWVMAPLAGLSLGMWTVIFQKARHVYVLRRDADAPGGWRRQAEAAFAARRTGQPDLDHKVLRAMAQRMEAAVDRDIKTILVLASVAPLMGLLGTVTGMIHSFQEIAAYGTGNIKALSTGISEALVTTQAGLAVAIPGLLAGNFLRRRAQRHKARVRQFHLLLGRGDPGARP